MKQLAVAVMAAGSSQRFKSPKLLSLLSGSPLILWSLKKLELFDLTFLVTHDEKLQSLARSRGIMPLVPHGEQKSDSLKVAVQEAKKQGAQGLMCLQADQPLLLPQTLRAFKEGFEEEEQELFHLSYNGQLSSPMLFSETLFDDLLKIEGDRGGSALLLDKGLHIRSKKIVAQRDFELLDVDTSDDLRLIETFIDEYKNVAK